MRAIGGGEADSAKRWTGRHRFSAVLSVIISVNTHSGLRPELFAEDLFRRNGINPNAPELATASATGGAVADAKAFTHKGMAMTSSSRKRGCGMLAHVREMLQELKDEGAPELKGRRIGAIKGYFLKISGDSEMHSQDKDPVLIEGQGRWRMLAQEPGEMWIKYRQADVDEKKTVSDL